MEIVEKFERDRERLLQDIRRLRGGAERLFEFFETPGPYYEDYEPEEERAEEHWKERAQARREALERFMEKCDDLTRIVEAFEAPESPEEYRASSQGNRNSERALAAVSTTGLLHAEMSYIDFRRLRRTGAQQQGVQQLTQKAKQVSSYIQNHIFPLLRKVSAGLVNLITTLVTPKSWSIEGGIGSNLFFFQGNVSLSIDFGK